MQSLRDYDRYMDQVQQQRINDAERALNKLDTDLDFTHFDQDEFTATTEHLGKSTTAALNEEDFIEDYAVSVNERGKMVISVWVTLDYF